MKRRALILALPILLVASAAQASAKKEEKKEEKTVGQYVDLQTVALPVVAEGGSVVNYVFVAVRIELSKTADATKLRTREPFFRDALVRASHRTPFTSAKDYITLDEAKLKTAMMREAAAIAGPGAVVGIKVLSQTPKMRSGAPRRPPAPQP